MKILIIEDEKKMASFLERGLKEEHYAVDIAYDGEKGWEYAMTNEYDLLIVDWMLPKMSGVELCDKFRKEGLKIFGPTSNVAAIEGSKIFAKLLMPPSSVIGLIPPAPPMDPPEPPPPIYPCSGCPPPVP